MTMDLFCMFIYQKIAHFTEIKAYQPKESCMHMIYMYVCNFNVYIDKT